MATLPDTTEDKRRQAGVNRLIAPPEPGLVDELGRQAGLTARAGIKGVGNLVGLLSDPIGGVINAATGAKLQTAGSLADKVSDAIGLPQPKNGAERVVQDAASAMASGGPLIGAGSRLAQSTAPAARKLGEFFGSAPVAQTVSNAASSAAASAANESGAGPIGQVAAGVGGALFPFAAQATGKAAGKIAQVAYDNAGAVPAVRGPLANQAGKIGVDAAPQSASPYPQAQALETARQNAVKMLGLPENNGPMDRAKALGFDLDVYHATNKNFDSFDIMKRGGKSDSGWYGDGDYTTPNPQYAERFIEKPVDGFAKGTIFEDGANIMALKARAKNQYDWRENEPGGIGMTQNDRSQSIEKRRSLESQGYDSVVVNNSRIKLPEGQALNDEQWGALTSASPMLKAIGKDKVEGLLRNGYDFRDFARSYGIDAAYAMPQEKQMVELATFNPNQLRSRFAAFDPARVNENDLLGAADPQLLSYIAGGAGAAVAAPVAYQYFKDKQRK